MPLSIKCCKLIIMKGTPAIPSWTSVLKEKRAWVGLDGFIDRIVQAVKIRQGRGEHFEAYHSLAELGRRIAEASTCNLNVELFKKFEKMGGNGPLLSNLLLNLGVQVHYTGTLGCPVHPLFAEFAKKTHAISLGEPGITHAIECQDGKLLLGEMQSLDCVTRESFLQKKPVQAWVEEFSTADVIAFQNWTMLYGMTDILRFIVSECLADIALREQRIWFFDLADPSKRSPSDLGDFLTLLPPLSQRGKVYLALNRSEAKILGDIVGNPCPPFDLGSVHFKEWLCKLTERLSIDKVVFHCCEWAAAVQNKEVVCVPALKAKRLRCLSGSGDHFNGGFLCGCLMNFDLQRSLLLGHVSALLYIEEGTTPSCELVQNYFNRLMEELYEK